MSLNHHTNEIQKLRLSCSSLMEHAVFVCFELAQGLEILDFSTQTVSGPSKDYPKTQ